MFQITPAFAVPFAEARFDQADALNPELAALFLAREAEGARYANPHPSMKITPRLFESEFSVFAWPEAAVQKLRDFCHGMLSRTIAQLSGYGAAEMEKLQIHSHTWFHVTRRGGYFGLHNHPMASWSGVYCVASGGEGTHPDSGVLHFANPLMLANMFVDPANTRLRMPYAPLRGRSYRLEPGQLVLFPSWVTHEVLPFDGDGERITVAFNCWFSWAEDV